MKDLANAASASGDHFRVEDHVGEVPNNLKTIVFANPNTKKVINALGREVTASMDQLIVSHPEISEWLTGIRFGLQHELDDFLV